MDPEKIFEPGKAYIYAEIKYGGTAPDSIKLYRIEFLIRHSSKYIEVRAKILWGFGAEASYKEGAQKLFDPRYIYQINKPTLRQRKTIIKYLFLIQDDLSN